MFVLYCDVCHASGCREIIVDGPPGDEVSISSVPMHLNELMNLSCTDNLMQKLLCDIASRLTVWRWRCYCRGRYCYLVGTLVYSLSACLFWGRLVLWVGWNTTKISEPIISNVSKWDAIVFGFWTLSRWEGGSKRSCSMKWAVRASESIHVPTGKFIIQILLRFLDLRIDLSIV